MKVLFIEYPKCSTCKKAKKWLEENNINYEDRHIVEETPTQKELEEWINKSKLPVKRFFNTSGLIYKEMNLKEKLQLFTEKEQIKLLESNGMLIKRPIIVSDKYILVGFKKEEWEEKLID